MNTNACLKCLTLFDKLRYRYSINMLLFLRKYSEDFVDDDLTIHKSTYRTPSVNINGTPMSAPKSFADKLDFSYFGVKRRLEMSESILEKKDQRYSLERVAALGVNLATAHFIVCRGGAVKFLNQDQFIKKQSDKPYDADLPNDKDGCHFIEAIDAGQMKLHYESLVHFEHLKHLKWISFSGNVLFDDWHLDYICSSLRDLEYLDISNCKKVTHRGISAVYKMKRLKVLNVENISDSTEFKLTCLLLENEMPIMVVNSDTLGNAVIDQGEKHASLASG